jgi:hypothetical protein
VSITHQNVPEGAKSSPRGDAVGEGLRDVPREEPSRETRTRVRGSSVSSDHSDASRECIEHRGCAELCFGHGSDRCTSDATCGNGIPERAPVKKKRVEWLPRDLEQCHGLFATENITDDQIVIEYTGTKISQEELNAMPPRARAYVMEVHGGFVDASRDEGMAKYINHTCTEPNCEFQKKSLDGEEIIVVCAVRAIKEGEELRVTYARSVSSDVFECFCPSCIDQAPSGRPKRARRERIDLREGSPVENPSRGRARNAHHIEGCGDCRARFERGEWKLSKNKEGLCSECTRNLRSISEPCKNPRHIDADDRYGKLHATVLKRDKRFMYLRDMRGYCQKCRDAVQTKRHIDQPDVTEESVEPSESDAVDTAVDAVDGVDAVDAAGTEELSEQSESDLVDTAVDAGVVDAYRKLLDRWRERGLISPVVYLKVLAFACPDEGWREQLRKALHENAKSQASIINAACRRPLDDCDEGWNRGKFDMVYLMHWFFEDYRSPAVGQSVLGDLPDLRAGDLAVIFHALLDPDWATVCDEIQKTLKVVTDIPEIFQSEAVLAAADHDYAEKAIASCQTAMSGLERWLTEAYADATWIKYFRAGFPGAGFTSNE